MFRTLRYSRTALVLCLLSATIPAACGGDDSEAPANAGTAAPAPGTAATTPGAAAPTPGGTDDTGMQTPADAYSYKACPVESHIGGFSAGLVTPSTSTGSNYSRVSGQVNDRVNPESVPTTLATEGDCTLVEGKADFCDPLCEFDEVCDGSGQCVPQPQGQDVGAATITGLVETTVQFEARAPGNNYEATGSLPYPVFEEGGAIELTSAGADGPALSMQAEGVAELVVNEPEVMVAPGQPAVVTWTPPAVPERSRVLATLNISLHGGDPVRIECDTADDGRLEVPAVLIDQLLGFSYSGFPAITITRQTSDRVETTAGCIDFRAYSTVNRHPVVIEGQISCDSTDDCPAGEMCTEELQCL